MDQSPAHGRVVDRPSVSAGQAWPPGIFVRSRLTMEQTRQSMPHASPAAVYNVPGRRFPGADRDTNDGYRPAGDFTLTDEQSQAHERP